MSAARGHRVASVHYVLLVIWLTAGSAASLRLAAGLPWTAALWQGALCVAAALPLLVLVVRVVALPKGLLRSHARLYLILSFGTELLEYLLPWLGWAALLWLLNRGRLEAGDALAAAGAVALFSYATGLAVVLALRPSVRDVEVTEIEVPIPDLPPAFDGYRILHLTDLHAGSSLAAADPKKRLAAVEAVSRDLVAFTGDLAASRDEMDRAAEALGRLPACDGAVAVLGNHDSWHGEPRVAAVLENHGLRVLSNSHCTVRRGGAALHIAGVGDASYSALDDVDAAFAGIPDEAIVILLSHAPDILLKSRARRASLVLAGHTHGGQVVLPRLGALYVATRLGREYVSGLHRVDGTWLYVNRGLGEIFPPMRLNCPPEAAVIVLRARERLV